ncbi:hypothetical protein [Herbidospora sp. NBRC 101105]|uniref:hypothetical protein n=1 Tax=Herbidospora sp. NBRC 101105 TaxID=3032195 RepID=UPI0024A1C0A7|nr:hypothetical protein [Herbidospora sp. NBRC 101105]GLX94546.1 hypothetical protein Hesp01_24960 [Herbidospora sp. NBRC 101105]
MRTLKRVAALAATAAVTITTFAVLAAPANAQRGEWYPCTIDGKPMWCMDV